MGGGYGWGWTTGWTTGGDYQVAGYPAEDAHTTPHQYWKVRNRGDVSKFMRRWAQDLWDDKLGIELDRGEWEARIRSWCDQKPGAVEEQEVIKLRTLLVRQVVTRVDRRPGEGLIM